MRCTVCHIRYRCPVHRTRNGDALLRVSDKIGEQPRVNRREADMLGAANPSFDVFQSLLAERCAAVVYRLQRATTTMNEVVHVNCSGMGIRGLCDNFTAPYAPEVLQRFLAFCRTLDLKVEHRPSSSGGTLLSLRSRRGAFTLLVPGKPGAVLRGSLYLSAPSARELEGDPLWDAFHRAVRLLLSTGTLWLYGEGGPRLSRFRNGKIVPTAREEERLGSGGAPSDWRTNGGTLQPKKAEGMSGSGEARASGSAPDMTVDAADLAHFLWWVRVDHLLERLNAAFKRGDAREADAVRQALRDAWQERYTKHWQEQYTKQ